MNLLFATSEIFPLIKTGGLADVSQALPHALQACGVNVTLIVPAYRAVLNALPTPLAHYEFNDAFLPAGTRLQEHRFPATGMRLLLVESTALFNRNGGPYVDEKSQDWIDNAQRFSIFCRAITALLGGRSEYQGSRFDVVHCNDWQTGLVPAFIRHEKIAVRSVFTIHNLAYQGIFSRQEFAALSLPESWWHYEYLEFHGNFSFLKAGIVFSDVVTTVSPTYAREIMQEPLACGMSGLLQFHAQKLHGILNGADYDVWNPSSDPHIPFCFDAEHLAEKTRNKIYLQHKLGLRQEKTIPLIGWVSRLVHQKGADWIVPMMNNLSGENIQWVVLGTGDKEFESALLSLANRCPQNIAVIIDYSESLAHRIEAAADLFIMPSRYEPCGLNQIYSLRYGAIPLVRATGGLADTVVDTDDTSLREGRATGFVYNGDTIEALEQTIRRALTYFEDKKAWKKIQKIAMAKRFDWKQSALQYCELYCHET